MLSEQGPDIATRLRVSREATGLSLRQVGAKFGRSGAWIGQLERTQRAISVQWGVRLATLYGVSVRWLAFGDGPDPQER